MRLVWYAGHEWKAMVLNGVRASQTHVVCSECGMRAKIGNWPDRNCRPRLAPISWLPIGEQTDDRVVVEVDASNGPSTSSCPASL